MSILFIINPIAGKGRTGDAIPVIQEYCRRKHVDYKITETHYPGNATEIARNENALYKDGIVAVGGDGTILEVANGLFGTDVPLGIIPLGSGNDFARVLNIPAGFEHIVQALDIITEKEPIRVDTARFNGKIFLNIASIGFDAEIIRDLPRVKKYIKGSGAYLISVFLKFINYRPKNVTLLVDGQTIKEKVFLAAICNGICYGGGMKVNPNGSISDGYLDLVLIKPVPKYKIPFLLLKFTRGEHLQLPYVTTYRCKNVEIISEDDLVVNADGECVSPDPIVFSLLPLSINVYAGL